jgi:hypothetical protein
MPVARGRCPLLLFTIAAAAQQAEVALLAARGRCPLLTDKTSSMGALVHGSRRVVRAIHGSRCSPSDPPEPSAVVAGSFRHPLPLLPSPSRISSGHGSWIRPPSATPAPFPISHLQRPRRLDPPVVRRPCSLPISHCWQVGWADMYLIMGYSGPIRIGPSIRIISIFFGYSLDTYPWRIRYVSVSGVGLLGTFLWYKFIK